MTNKATILTIGAGSIAALSGCATLDNKLDYQAVIDSDEGGRFTKIMADPRLKTQLSQEQLREPTHYTNMIKQSRSPDETDRVYGMFMKDMEHEILRSAVCGDVNMDSWYQIFEKIEGMINAKDYKAADPILSKK